MKKAFLIFICFSMLGGVCFINLSCAQRAGVDVGDKAPDFTLPDVSSGQVALQDVVKTNEATLLVFWATWCPYCRQEVPELNKINAEYQGKGLKVLAVDIGETQQKVASFIGQAGIQYTVLLDSDNSVAGQYGVRGIPANVLVDKDGIIRYKGTSPPPAGLLPKK